MELKIFEKETLREGAQLAITHRLFVNKWQLRRNLQRVLVDNPVSHVETSIVLAFVAGVPVGILFRETYITRNKIRLRLYHHFFVRRKFRGQQIATKLFQHLPRPANKHVLIGNAGVKNSANFFKKLDEKFVVFSWFPN